MEEKDLEQLKKEHDEYLNGWKRAKADFINYKKDEEERMQAIVEYGKRGLLLKILPILDNIERALKEIQKPAQSPESGDGQIAKGFFQIASQWREFLKSQGIEGIETMGKQFNSEMHEAVGKVDGQEHGMVAEEVEKGYTIQGKLLRPAKVKVIGS